MSSAAYNQASKQNPRSYRAKKEKLKKNSQTIYSRAAHRPRAASGLATWRRSPPRRALRCASSTRGGFRADGVGPEEGPGGCYPGSKFLKDQIASDPGLAQEANWDDVNALVGTMANQIVAGIC